ncbi:MAG TPA: hypothetical protein VFA01_01235 [Candidatus Dormibacteraeota bacterium]|jgi:hypothetical protein|nr:hypothetical protein [Candidatus Dormibacteraeota bacterium]
MGTENRALTLSVLPDDATAYYELWLRGDGRNHDADSIAAFASAHRAMSGRQVDVFARGYRGWLERRGLSDTAQAFAEYIEPRYRRWRATLLRSDLITVLATVRRGRTLAA